jgi:hypothetical protein
MIIVIVLIIIIIIVVDTYCVLSFRLNVSVVHWCICWH